MYAKRSLLAALWAVSSAAATLASDPPPPAAAPAEPVPTVAAPATPVANPPAAGDAVPAATPAPDAPAANVDEPAEAPAPVVVPVLANEQQALEFFEKKIRPLLVQNCFSCHSAETNSQAGLRVDDLQGLIVGGNSGPAIVPGKPEESLVIKAVRHTDDDLKMPPRNKISEQEIADLTAWIQAGAPWTKVVVPSDLGKYTAEYDELRKEHWSWQPLKTSKAPAVRNAAWPRDDIDRYLLAELEKKGLQPVADAERVTLLRRVTFDLTGLPPTLAEVEAFLADDSPEAFEKVVDRLLASPAFGERWGRHWLDVARYGESTGSARNLPMPHAWRYRDWVIAAFNQDKPFDQFIREQIAGDLLPSATPQERDQQLIATGFLALGVKDVNQRFKVRYIMDNVDEQIDTVSRSVLGLTASCARCHDHKFDPIPATDYYALAGIFRSSDLCDGLRNKMGGGGLDYYDTEKLLPLFSDKPADPASAAKVTEAQAAAKAAQEELQRLVKERNAKTPQGTRPDPEVVKVIMGARQKFNRLRREALALTDPAVVGKVALGVRDSKTISDTEIRVRGEAEKLGPTVPRGFLSVLEFADQPKVNPAQSGRLELAQWLTHANNPLTPRVIANRVWAHLFGRGIVSTVDNFGVTGDVPTHPELLDHLALRLKRDGWSVKKLVRSIVLSHAYQLSSAASPAGAAFDPQNQLVWRHTPRRLAAEEIRDATLAISGKLNLTPIDGSPAKDYPVIELRNNGPEAKKLQQTARESTHRSVYLPLLRTLVPESLQVFDFAEQGLVTGHRDLTTVAPQALYLLNDPFVRRQSLVLAERLLARGDLDDAGRVYWAYRATVGRTPTRAEIDRALAFLSDFEVAAQEEFAKPDSMLVAAAAPAQLAAATPPPAANSTSNTIAGGAANGGVKKPEPAVAVAVNPDDPVPEEPVVEEVIALPDARTAAWASLNQSLLGSADFLYLK
jgi:cytochrome c553